MQEERGAGGRQPARGQHQDCAADCDGNPLMEYYNITIDPGDFVEFNP